MLCNPADSALVHHGVACFVRIPSSLQFQHLTLFLTTHVSSHAHIRHPSFPSLHYEVTHRTPEASASRHISIAYRHGRMTHRGVSLRTQLIHVDNPIQEAELQIMHCSFGGRQNIFVRHALNPSSCYCPSTRKVTLLAAFWPFFKHEVCQPSPACAAVQIGCSSSACF